MDFEYVDEAQLPPDLVEVRVLGPLGVRRTDGSWVDAREWRTGKTADLLRLLALNAGRPVSVDRLLEAFWPNVEAKKGQASLRTAASQVRQVIGQNCLVRQHGGLVLRDVWVDALVFRDRAREVATALSLGELSRAVTVAREADALYLADLNAYDGGAEWVVEEREQLRSAHLAVLADAADASVQLGWMRDAIEFAARSLEVDPFSERAFRVLMAAHAGRGETEQALRAFETCRHRLADELGLDPSPQTRALHLELLRSSATVSATTLFTGRAAETEWIRDAVQAGLSSRTPEIIAVVGAPGVGVSRLLAEACAELPATVVSRACTADVERAPHRLLADALAAAQGLPCVLILDDLDLAAPGDVRRLARELADCRDAVTVVAGLHQDTADAPSNARTVLSDPEVAPYVRCLEVQHLGIDELATLAGQLLAGRAAPDLVGALWGASGGNLARAVALLREWTHAGRVAATSRGLSLMPVGTGTSKEPIAHQLLATAQERLDASQLDVLHLAAVIGGPVRASALVRVLEDVDPRRVSDALDRLADLSVLVLGPRGYEFRHPLLRDAALAWLRPATQRRLHGWVAERAPLAAADRVPHWLEAGEPQLACAAAFEAAEEAMADARHDDARIHLRQACRLGDLPEAAPADRAALFERLGDVCLRLGRRQEASEAYAVAVAVARTHGLMATEGLAAKLSTAQGTPPGARAPRLQLVGAADTSAVSARERSAPAGEQATEARLRQAVVDADRAGSDTLAVEARLALMDAVLLPQRRFKEVEQLAIEARSVSTDPVLLARVTVVTTLPQVALGGGALALAPLEQAWENLRESSDLATRAQVGVALCAVVHDLGLPPFEALWTQVTALAEISLPDDGWRWVRVRALVERGEHAAARQEAVRMGASTGNVTHHTFLCDLADANLRVSQADFVGAAATLHRCIDRCRDTGNLLFLPLAAARLAAIEADHDRESALELIDSAEDAQGELPLGRERVAISLARAALRTADGKPGPGAEAAAKAARLAGTLGLVFLEAEAFRQRASILVEVGDRSEAGQAIQSASVCYHDAGAVEQVKAMQAWLRRLHGVPAAWPRPKPLPRPASLSRPRGAPALERRTVDVRRSARTASPA